MNIGRNIRFYRKLKKLTQQELSKKTGIDRANLAHMESGRRALSIDKLIKITEVLKVDIYTIIGISTDLEYLRKENLILKKKVRLLDETIKLLKNEKKKI